jgi:hypothetical protein
VVDGDWKCAGVENIPCELVRVSSRIRGPGKAAQIPKEGNGSLTFR